MITKFKIFNKIDIQQNLVENKNQNFYYYIPYTDELFKLAVQKLPTTQEIKDDIIDSRFYKDIDHIGFFICIPGIYATLFGHWSVCNDKDDGRYTTIEKAHNFFKDNNYTFGGEIKLEDYEIKSLKYNL